MKSYGWIATPWSIQQLISWQSAHGHATEYEGPGSEAEVLVTLISLQMDKLNSLRSALHLFGNVDGLTDCLDFALECSGLWIAVQSE